MKYSEVISEILTRTDEGFSTTGAERARKYFRVAVTALIKEQKYGAVDILKLRTIVSRTVTACTIGFNDISGTACGLMEIKHIFRDPACTVGDGLLITLTSVAKLRRYSFAPSLQPSGRRVEYLPTGDRIRFIPDKLKGKELNFDIILTPPPYKDAACNINWSWTQNTDMNEWFSFVFIQQAIEVAAEMMRAEVNR